MSPTPPLADRRSMRGRECRCRICEPGSGTTLDDGEQNVIDMVERRGWMVMNVQPQDRLPGWSFTIGLTHSFGAPEFVMTGMNHEALHASLNIVGEMAKRGLAVESNIALTEVLDGYDVMLRPVEIPWHLSLFGWCRWFAQHDEPRFLQVVWPDLAGRFPGDVAFNPTINHLQPDLAVAPSSHGLVMALTEIPRVCLSSFLTCGVG
jgi:Domain of unknown function (DUF4262)